jgi:hypothetical protein
LYVVLHLLIFFSKKELFYLTERNKNKNAYSSMRVYVIESDKYVRNDMIVAFNGLHDDYWLVY